MHPSLRYLVPLHPITEIEGGVARYLPTPAHLATLKSKAFLPHLRREAEPHLRHAPAAAAIELQEADFNRQAALFRAQEVG